MPPQHIRKRVPKRVENHCLDIPSGEPAVDNRMRRWILFHQAKMGRVNAVSIRDALKIRCGAANYNQRGGVIRMDERP
jgi:hypothetical protein